MDQVYCHNGQAKLTVGAEHVSMTHLAKMERSGYIVDHDPDPDDSSSDLYQRLATPTWPSLVPPWVSWPS